MRTVLFLSVLAIAACGDGQQPTTAPANTRAIAGPAAQANDAAVPAAQAKPARFTVATSAWFTVSAGFVTNKSISCPTGTTPVGGGFNFSNMGNWTAPPTVIVSAATQDGWFVKVMNAMPGAADATFEVQAICAS